MLAPMITSPKPFDPRLLVIRVAAHLRRVYHYDLQAAQAQSAQAHPASVSNEEPGQSAALQPGWASCQACGYMGPTTKFRKENQYGQRYMMCPHCQESERLVFG
jgi:hypothetical protein